jgi:hypothetical protein
MELTDKTVSLFYRELVNRAWQYKKQLLESVSWRVKGISTVTDSGLKTANQCIVRIPYTPVKIPRKGDFMVLGDVTYVDNMRDTYGDDCMVVTGVTDNTKVPHAPHLKVVGS